MMNFEALHNQSSPLLICNVWDVASAKLAEKLQFSAIGTSSGAIASMLGYKDGEEMNFSELEYIVSRIVKSVNIPLSVDLEGGYSRDPAIIAEHISRLTKLGIVGINIEDSIVTKQREMMNSDAFSEILTKVILLLKRRATLPFINVRTDSYLLDIPDPLQNTLDRAMKYYEAGANGLFVPCITNPQDIAVIAKKIPLPLNVMCMPQLPDFSTLHNLGVKRISMGNFLYNKSIDLLENEWKVILQENSFHKTFDI